MACPLGVVAVDRPRARASDDTGYTMPPINLGIGLPTGLTLATQTGLLRQGGEPREPTVPLLGIVPLSNGTILFFDALNLRHLNTSIRLLGENRQSAADQPSATVTGVDVQGNTQTSTGLINWMASRSGSPGTSPIPSSRRGPCRAWPRWTATSP